jgi:hypothetical protein
MLIALTRQARNRPSALNTIEQWHLISCLHAIGCVFVIQNTSDIELNELIVAIKTQSKCFPLRSSNKLLDALKRLDWATFMEEVAEMHGEINRDWFRKTTEHLIAALREAVNENRDLDCDYIG